MATWRFDAIGTVWEIETDAPLAAPVRDAVTATIDGFDREWSRFRADSLVTRLAAGGAVPAPADAERMLEAYRALSDATAGAVNPLVGESLAALGYDRELTLVAGPARPAPPWTDRLQVVDGELRLSAPAVIDVGALGKGRLVDLVLAALGAVDGRVVVDAGGDMAVSGGSVRVGLEHPYDTTRAIGVVEVRDGAVCGSAVNRRAWGEGLHHVLDARTGEPVRAWAATWAFADRAMTADAVATALFFDGGPELAARWGVEWVRMSTTGAVQRSAGCPAELFLRSGGAEPRHERESAEE